MSDEQRENLEAILRRSALPVDSDVSEQRRLLRELISAQELRADVGATEAGRLLPAKLADAEPVIAERKASAGLCLPTL